MLGADGFQDIEILASDECCPVDVCAIDPCALICNFISLLPSGPLWDNAKAFWRDQYKTDCNGIMLCQPVPPGCTTIIQHSIYTAKRLYSLLKGPLWEALRESNPHTAFATMDDWLDRLGWQDCFGTACRSQQLGTLTPYEVEGVCGPVFCGIDTPPELEFSVKHAIIVALSRLKMGVIKNLEGINWVIEPLGVTISALDPICDDEQPSLSCLYSFQIAPFESKKILKWNGVPCPVDDDSVGLLNRKIDAFYSRNNCVDGSIIAGLPEMVWPAVLAAECLVRAMLPCSNEVLIRRACV